MKDIIENSDYIVAFSLETTVPASSISEASNFNEKKALPRNYRRMFLDNSLAVLS